MKKETIEKLELVEKLFNEKKSDEEISKLANIKVSKVPIFRGILGLTKHAGTIDIFNSGMKKTVWSDTSEKHQVSFWIPHNEAKKLGMTDSKYEFFGTVLGKQKIQITFKQLDD